MDTQLAPAPKISNQFIALVAITLAAVMTFAAFFLSRADHDLKLMSLTAVLSLGSGLMGVAGTLLVGIQTYKTLTSTDLPPGSSVHSSQQQQIDVPANTSPKPQA
jgi:hypothetical protein